MLRNWVTALYSATALGGHRPSALWSTNRVSEAFTSSAQAAQYSAAKLSSHSARVSRGGV